MPANSDSVGAFGSCFQWPRNCQVRAEVLLIGLLAVLVGQLVAVGNVHAGPDGNRNQADDLEFDTLVVCPLPLQDSLQPWIRYRSEQGHRIHVIPSAATAIEVRGAIRDLAQLTPFRNIVLVGDVDFAVPERRFRPSPWTTPTFYLDAKVNVRFGSEPQLASDNPYADLDDDGIPDVTIGRLPVDSPEQLVSWTERMIRYETEHRSGYSSRRVAITAESGGFGFVADSLLDLTARNFIRSGIPSAFEVQATFAGVNSPFCPDPRQLASSTINNLNAGSLFWVFIGHGQTSFVNPLRHQREWFNVWMFPRCRSFEPKDSLRLRSSFVATPELLTREMTA